MTDEYQMRQFFEPNLDSWYRPNAKISGNTNTKIVIDFSRVKKAADEFNKQCPDNELGEKLKDILNEL